MPRYSIVLLFPIIIALCVCINIRRYPAVSAMVKGETVESRWLGQAEVFNFPEKKPSESYQGYHPESGDATISRTSREPIPVPDSYSSPSSSRPTASSPTDRYDSPYSAGSSYSPNIGGTGTTNRNSSDRYAGSYSDNSYSNDYSYNSRSNGGGNTGTSPASSSAPYASSYSDNSYSRSSYGTESTSQRDNYSNYGDIRSQIDDDDVNRSESRTTNDTRFSRQEYFDYENIGSTYNVGGTYRADTPNPGYSSRYSAGETASTSTLPATTEPEFTVPRTPRQLSLQERLELRLATPFSWEASDSKDAEQYIPPDFLPPHENGVVRELFHPPTTSVTITPISFDAVTPASPNQEMETGDASTE